MVCAHPGDTAPSSACLRLIPAPAMRTQVVDPDTGGEKLDDIRTSFGTFLRKGETDVIAAIERRVAEWSQVPLANQEQLQILRRVAARAAAQRVRVCCRFADRLTECYTERIHRYGLGQKYSDHWDWFDQKTLDVRAHVLLACCFDSSWVSVG